MINLDSPNFTHLQPSGSKRKPDDSSAPLPEKRHRVMSPEFPNYDRILKVASTFGSYISSKFLTQNEKRELAILAFQRGGVLPEHWSTLHKNFLFLPQFDGRTKHFCLEVLNALQLSPSYTDLTPPEKQTIDRKISKLCQKVEQGRNQRHDLRLQAVAARAKSKENLPPTVEVELDISEEEELAPENPEWKRTLENANMRLNEVSRRLREFQRAVQEYQRASAAFDEQRAQLTTAYSMQFEKMEDPTWVWSFEDTRALNYIEDRLYEYALIMNSLAEEETDPHSEQPGILPALSEYNKANVLYDAVKADFDQRVRELEKSTDLVALREMKAQLDLVAGMLRSANPLRFRQ